jgi:hypothetical protein
MKIFKKITCTALALLSLSVAALPVSADWDKSDDGKTYYIQEDGKKATGFTEIEGDTYYFNSKGEMLTGSYKIGGASYRFGSDGKMFTGWAKNKSGDYYYYAADGKRASGFTTISGSTYYFTKDGVMLKGASYKIGGETYTFAADGKVSGTSAKSAAAAGTSDYFLSGYFGESFETITKRNPNVMAIVDDPEMGIAADLVPKSLKLGDTYAVGADLYISAEGKYFAGGRVFMNTSDTVPASLLSDYSGVDFTKSQSTAIYNAFVKQYTEKYGDPVDLSDIGVDASEYAEIDEMTVFLSDTAMYMVVSSEGVVGVIGIDIAGLASAYGYDFDASTIINALS